MVTDEVLEVVVAVDAEGVSVERAAENIAFFFLVLGNSEIAIKSNLVGTVLHEVGE